MSRRKAADEWSGFLPIVSRTMTISVPLLDILFIERASRVIIVTTKEQQFRYYEKMEKVQSELNGHFYPCHQGMEINLWNIEAMRDRQVFFTNGTSIPLSDKAYCRTRQVYSNYILNGKKGFVREK